MGRVGRSSGAAIAIVTLLTAGSAGATPSEGRSLSTGVDLGFRTARDDLIVPLASSGVTVGLGGRFVGAVGPGLLDAGLRVQDGALFDRDEHPAAWVFHGLRVAYLQ